MTPFAIFGINNDGVNTAINVLILVLVVVWLALVFWTYADARRRIEDPILVGCATLAALFPFVGTIVYMIVRPPEFADDVRLRELEMQAAEARLVLARPPALPALRPPGPGRLPALPELPAQAARTAAHLQQGDRPGLDAVPLLRGRDGRQAAVGLAAPAPDDRDGRRHRGLRPAVRALASPPRLSTKEPLCPGPSSWSSRTRSPAGSPARSSPASSARACASSRSST